MKATKTVKKGKQPSGKRAGAAGKKEKAAPAEAVGGPVAVRTVRKRKTARTAPAGDETPGKKKNRKTRTARVKPEETAPSEKAAVSRKTTAKKVVPSGKTAVNAAGKEMAPETLHTAKTATKSTKITSRSPRPHIKSAKIVGRSAPERKAVKKMGAGSVLSEKDKKSSPGADFQVAIKEMVAPGLPEEYGENEFFLIPVEPRVVYASWEITQDSLPKKEGGLEVRFFDATKGEHGGPGSQAFLDIAIPERVGDAFFHVGIHGREVIAEIGHRGADGSFKPLLTSRKVLIPGAMGTDELGAAAKLPETGSYGSKPPEK